MKEKWSGWSCNPKAGHCPGRYRSVSLWQKQPCPDSVSLNTGFPASAAIDQVPTWLPWILLTCTLSFCHPKSHFPSCTFGTFWITFVLFLSTHNCQVLLSSNVEMRKKKSEVVKIIEKHSEAPLPFFYFPLFVLTAGWKRNYATGARQTMPSTLLCRKTRYSGSCYHCSLKCKVKKHAQVKESRLCLPGLIARASCPPNMRRSRRNKEAQ